MPSNHSVVDYVALAICGAFLGGLVSFATFLLVVGVCSATVSGHNQLDYLSWTIIGFFAAILIGACGGAGAGVVWLRRCDKGSHSN